MAGRVGTRRSRRPSANTRPVTSTLAAIRKRARLRRVIFAISAEVLGSSGYPQHRKSARQRKVDGNSNAGAPRLKKPQQEGWGRSHCHDLKQHNRLFVVPRIDEPGLWERTSATHVLQGTPRRDCLAEAFCGEGS